PGPYQARAVVLEHGDGRSLIDSQVVDVEPAGGARRCERRVERVAEAVAGEQRSAVGLAHRVEGRDPDLGRERDRATGSGGRDGAVVLHLRERRSAREVAVELPIAPAERQRQVARSVGGGEPPDAIAVPGPAARVGGG